MKKITIIIVGAVSAALLLCAGMTFGHIKDKDEIKKPITEEVSGEVKEVTENIVPVADIELGDGSDFSLYPLIIEDNCPDINLSGMGVEAVENKEVVREEAEPVQEEIGQEKEEETKDASNTVPDNKDDNKTEIKEEKTEDEVSNQNKGEHDPFANVPLDESIPHQVKMRHDPFSHEYGRPDVPLYAQQIYYRTPYGSYGTVASHGCGITSLSMALSHIKGKDIMPDELAEKYGQYNTVIGSSWDLFPAACKDYGISCEQVFWDPDKINQALSDGKMVISNQMKGVFSGGGHFILLTGLAEDGKIFVNDPNFGNWEKYPDAFEHGFEPKSVTSTCSCYWILG